MTHAAGNPVQWALLVETLSEEEALVVTSMLQAEGIRYRRMQEAIGQLCSLRVGSLGTIRIEVAREHLEAAQELISSTAGPC